MPETFSAIWICLIYLLGLALIVWELLTPGFVIGLIGLFTVSASIYWAFHYYPDSPTFGIALIGATIVIVPLMFRWCFKRVTLQSAQNLTDGYTSADVTLLALLGKTGMSVTPLRPSGLAQIEGRGIDVTADNVMIEKQTPIQVVKVEGRRIVVRATGNPRQQE